jgi:hypothetical protein
VIDINNGHLTTDIDLYFTREDVANLFDWDKQNYTRICEFSAGTWLEENNEAETNQLIFQIYIQRVLTELGLFEYLSEVQEARESLFNVCRNNTTVGAAFKIKYPEIEQFNLIFN